MKLYQIKARLMGDDLDQESILGVLLSDSDEKVYNFIAKYFAWGRPSWEDQYERGTKQKIMEKHGDFSEEYLGDEYDQKYAWVELGPISKAETATLKKFKIPFLSEEDGRIYRT